MVAAQLALLRGARVIRTAGEGNHEFLSSLGVTPVRYGPGLHERIRAAAPEGVDAYVDRRRAEPVVVRGPDRGHHR
ncbi:hypothetical protein [Micromonospora sp. NPDC005161]